MRHIAKLVILTVLLPVAAWAQTPVSSLSDIGATGDYIINGDIDAAGFSASIASFSGTLQAGIDPATKMPYRIKNLSVPLFTSLTGTVKNLVIEKVTITSGTNVGAVACTASGSARIYNVGILYGSVKGTGDVGGLVGQLDGEARVVNCYSYADIKGGTKVGGLVGNNKVATTSSNLKTMVFGCMFYGDISSTISGSNVAPIYNGTIITNRGDKSGVSNFNYFWAGAKFMQDETKTPNYTYNCALMAETRFLNRFEFFRHLLNGHRELAGWWATGTYSKSEMLKWVLLPDSIGSDHPFPILMQDGKYPSVVNIDADNATTQSERNKGGLLGTLSVTIQMGSGGAQVAPPSGASISTSQLTLNITDKDTAHFNFNYYKVQLPYYNDVGSGNYTGNRVVTGWKIVGITGGTPGTYSTGEDVTYDANGNLTETPYNFADRKCTNKDLYSQSGRIFNQGAYWDVPEGVTAITIEPYWAKAVYLADAYVDVVYNTGMTSATNVPNVGGGQKYTNGNSYSIAGESQMVFTSMGNAIASSNSGLFQGVDANSHTVYDYAVVLVGNYHHYYPDNARIEASNSKPYTVTSIDLDGDNEPDYSYIMRFDGRQKVHPVRVDFINVPGLGMAQKSTGGTGTYNFGIMQPKGWFESTNTSLFRVTQFEYDCNKDGHTRGAAPYILQGGVMEQWVLGQNQGYANKTTYFHVGGNVWFKEFHRGTHQDEKYPAKHPPVSVTGGDFDQFHLTGLYRANANTFNDNAECYITGGRFGVVAGTGMDGIGTSDGKGNITWIIDNADISEFYAGSFNAANPARGKLHTIINGGYINFFCGGPKFGDMYDGKTVTTIATGTTFGTFYGAGYGGNSYSRQAPFNANDQINIDWNKWVRGETSYGNNNQGDNATFNGYKRDYKTAPFDGVSTRINYQFIPMSGNAKNCCRLWIEYVKFSLATTRNVTSTLTNCKVLGNFYGGGSLGKVDGDVTSTLDGCEVLGNVFGAGYSASLPPVYVDSIGFRERPFYYEQLGTYRPATKGDSIVYEWRQTPSNARIADATTDAVRTERAINQAERILYTDIDLSKTNLGAVTGTVTLNIKGNSVIGTLENGSLKAGTGNVYGGGDESTVFNATTPGNAKTEVILEGNTHVLGHVFAGGNEGVVSGSTTVKVK